MTLVLIESVNLCFFFLSISVILFKGTPGPQASTDIYDAVIESESHRRDECVYILNNVQSRKPPQKAPNWKTSYRLAVPGLVAVLRLSSSREALPRDRLVEWAEVVPMNPKDTSRDWEERSRGKMAIRLLTRTDCPGMPTESEIEIGTRVAIIDLRVFVPEVVSVLATFASDSFQEHLSMIPFINRLIGVPEEVPRFQAGPNTTVGDMLHQAITRSEIEVLKRLSKTALNDLVSSILSLRPVASLYGTQLEVIIFSSLYFY
jgi:hypothetical protein